MKAKAHDDMEAANEDIGGAIHKDCETPPSESQTSIKLCSSFNCAVVSKES